MKFLGNTCEAGDRDIRDFLDSLNLPKLTEEQKSEVDSPITRNERSNQVLTLL